ncbi:hypothetical protein FisN_13Lh340 [Fistulifera solaris]|uniref:Uncharacterized protein n=1 Tax=Fistulifera solaris TaxID=1519565 RepID=A0A1Z5KLC2_FISSO|nr:hypothetical protein FisN_13Lh340 [Fistulifera solaris]|eukprot:GAX27114.1 hypothetical protein FisN_13Lh340 [Fistulifera solaris]
MKFVAGIIAALFASSEAHRIGNKKVDARKLMASAVQVDPKTMRKLQNNNNENAFQLTNAHSIRFSSCTSLTTSSPNDEIMFGDLIQYTKKGQIVAEKSYVLFNICETDSCAYYSNSDPLFMVDLGTYMASMVDYMPQQHQEYCNACEGAQDYCQNNGANQDAAQANEGQEQQAEGQQEGEQQQANEGQQEGAEQQAEGQQEGAEQQAEGQQEGQQEGAEQQAEGGQRKLQNNNNNNFEVIDCNVCEARNCWANNNNADQQQAEAEEGYVAVNDQNIVAWVEGIAGCQQTASYWDAYPLYAGWICNAAGNGVEIGIFLDDQCSIYTSTKNYKNVVGQDASELFYNSQDVVTYPFMNALSCGNQVQYITPEEYANMQANGNDANNAENGNGEASQMCRELMNGQAISVDDCNADGQEDQVDNEIEGDETAGYAWYKYLITNDNSANNQAVCKILQTMEGEYTVVYNGNEKHGSGSFYDYSTKSGFQKRKGLFITFIVLGVVAIVAGIFVVQGSNGSKGKRGDSLLQ